ncbi:MAG: hypothetical protein M1415_03110 [Firmicutes bacterium]|nr:hypothetical protein [Bacillota bacterium]
MRIEEVRTHSRPINRVLSWENGETQEEDLPGAAMDHGRVVTSEKQTIIQRARRALRVPWDREDQMGP